MKKIIIKDKKKQEKNKKKTMKIGDKFLCISRQ